MMLLYRSSSHCFIDPYLAHISFILATHRSGGLPHAGYPNEGETEEGNSSASDSAATEELLRRHVLRLGGEYSSGSSSG